MKIFKCNICHNIVELINDNKGVLVCCNKKMQEKKINTEDGAHEKHVPTYELKGNLLSVTIGEIEHPMSDEHYIEWISLVENNKTIKMSLKPGENPKASFEVKTKNFTIYAYCNLHGLYKVESDS